MEEIAVLRYRISRDVKGRYFVLPAWLAVIPIEDTYATRHAAEEAAEWLNHLARAAPNRPPGRPSNRLALTAATR
ncbi:MAG TPA: hypothetical protein EYP56_07865 [Planctomycetaceae bacterium]|nr:hypothetical protein [Planctomycetaceae bacterium]HIQ21162.1 hypothetical protein [Planctomycetota bacterium]